MSAKTPVGGVLLSHTCHFVVVALAVWVVMTLVVPVAADAGASCASWPTPSADRYTGPWNATTKHPILVIGTRFDPTTPLRNAQRAARRLGNAALLVHDGYGHTSHQDPSTCVIQATTTYLINLTTPPPGTVCPSDRLPFDPSFGQPAP